MHQIERGILYEDSYLGVTVGALAYSHGVIFIDAPLRAEDARAWRSVVVNQRGGTNRLLISLDAHPDRTLGTRALECTIIAHQKAAHVFRNRPTIFKGQSAESGAIWETYNDAIGMRWASPDITFTQRMSLYWGGPEVILEHRPGPTPGSIWVTIPESRVVFVGDAIILNQPPFMAQADLDAWLQNLEELKTTYHDYTIISGRGGPVASEEVAFQQKVLKEIIEAMQKLFGKNSSSDATEELIPALLSNYKFPHDLRELYTKRLRYGLHQSFARRFRSLNTLGQPEVADEES